MGADPRNAFTHETGIHATANVRDTFILKRGLMSPEIVGHRPQLVVDRPTGRRCSADAANVDIVLASVDALFSATNHLMRLRENGSCSADSGPKDADVA